MLIRNATLADGRVRDVRIEGETIAEVDEELETTGDVYDVDGKLLLPGMIDAHVHFREPGDSHKETWRTGSRSAAAGGVTTVVDQPNTDPPTIDRYGFEVKSRFTDASTVDYGINGGVTAEWDPDSLFEQPVFALGEVFLADSTGEMGIDADLYERAVELADEADVPVTVHAEDETLFDESAKERDDPDAWSAFRTPEAEIEAIERACDVARDLETTIHVAHTSTPKGVDIAVENGMTCEVTSHHLFLSRDDLDDLGTFGRMNPPLRDERRREQLYDRLVEWVGRHYREELWPADLADPALMNESRAALNELSDILALRGLYGW